MSRLNKICRCQIKPVILSGMCLARSARDMESKDPGTAASGTSAARHSPCGPYREVARMPCIAIAAVCGHRVLRPPECLALRSIHFAQDDRVGRTMKKG